MKQYRFTPYSSLGKELIDIVSIMYIARASNQTMQAALLGRIGVSASCWPDFMSAKINAPVSIQTDHRAHRG